MIEQEINEITAGIEEIQYSRGERFTIKRLEKTRKSLQARLEKLRDRKGGGWLLYAVGSAVFAALTAIFGKIGISGIDSNLGTAIRTIVVLIMAWVMVFVTKKQSDVRRIPRRELVFILLSGLATGASWLCYYRALHSGDASVVVPIDKLSILVTVLFSRIFFNERLTWKSGVGLALITAGTLIMVFL